MSPSPPTLDARIENLSDDIAETISGLTECFQALLWRHGRLRRDRDELVTLVSAALAARTESARQTVRRKLAQTCRNTERRAS